MAATALRPAVVDFMRLATSSERLDLAAEQVTSSRRAFAGTTIRDANLRQDFGVIVVAIKRAAGHMEFNPAPETTIGAGDQLVVLGHPDQLRRSTPPRAAAVQADTGVLIASIRSHSSSVTG